MAVKTMEINDVIKAESVEREGPELSTEHPCKTGQAASQEFC